MRTDLLHRITRTDGVPCVRDTGIPVSHVLSLIGERKTEREILGVCPVLEAEDIEAVWQFLGTVPSSHMAATLGISRRQLIGYFESYAIPRPVRNR
jgi:Uncharacterized conserved protein